MLKTTTIFLFLFLFSCTVTKRVHRPGFHVEWKKNYKTQRQIQGEQESEKEAKSEKAEVSEIGLPACRQARREPQPADVESDISIPNEDKGELVEARLSENLDDSNTEALEVKESPKKSPKNTKPKKNLKIGKEAKTFFIEKSRKYAPLNMPKKKKKSYRESNWYLSDNLLYTSYAFFGFAAFLLLGCLFSFMGIWLIEEMFYALVFNGNGFIAGLLGFILFLILLVIVFIAYGFVHYILGGTYIGLIVAAASVGIGLLFLLASSVV